jgi:RimJ/RimL family protein N-acetyltransferase
MKIEPMPLEGSFVRLEPLTLKHAPPLADAGLDPELWRWIPTPVTSLQEMRDYVTLALDELQRGISVPYAIVDRTTGLPIGSTRFANIERSHRRLEIGWTWIARAAWRTPVNTEAKRLLLTHAFEVAGANRVEFKTDALNERSRRALLRLGATQEGVFRKHLITASGRIRDTVYFSIIDTEWPAIKARLSQRLP